MAHWMRFSLKPSVGLLYQSSPWVAASLPRRLRVSQLWRPCRPRGAASLAVTS